MTLLRATVGWGLLAGAMALAGCTTGGPTPTGPGGRPLHPVEGEWLSTDGVAMSTFNNGVFTTTATDTGNKLADGSYRVGQDKTIAIQGTSLIRQTPIAFNCLMAGTEQLNCTNATGQNFTLRRRGAQPA